MMRFLFFFLLSFFMCCSLSADIYFWKDDNGIRHYANTSPPAAENVTQIQEARSRELAKAFSLQKHLGQPFKVQKVYDGDTILVEGIGLVFKIRLVGIDAPERGYHGKAGQPYAEKARAFLENRLNGKTITIKSYGLGGYNRQLAEVFHRHHNINLTMIREGLAEVYRGKRPANLDSDFYFKTERRARQQKKGVWKQGRTYKSPKQWRKEHPYK